MPFKEYVGMDDDKACDMLASLLNTHDVSKLKPFDESNKPKEGEQVLLLCAGDRLVLTKVDRVGVSSKHGDKVNLTVIDEDYYPGNYPVKLSFVYPFADENIQIWKDNKALRYLKVKTCLDLKEIKTKERLLADIAKTKEERAKYKQKEETDKVDGTPVPDNIVDTRKSEQANDTPERIVETGNQMNTSVDNTPVPDNVDDTPVPDPINVQPEQMTKGVYKEEEDIDEAFLEAQQQREALERMLMEEEEEDVNSEENPEDSEQESEQESESEQEVMTGGFLGFGSSNNKDEALQILKQEQLDLKKPTNQKYGQEMRKRLQELDWYNETEKEIENKTIKDFGSEKAYAQYLINAMKTLISRATEAGIIDNDWKQQYMDFVDQYAPGWLAKGEDYVLQLQMCIAAIPRDMRKIIYTGVMMFFKDYIHQPWYKPYKMDDVKVTGEEKPKKSLLDKGKDFVGNMFGHEEEKPKKSLLEKGKDFVGNMFGQDEKQKKGPSMFDMLSTGTKVANFLDLDGADTIADIAGIFTGGVTTQPVPQTSTQPKLSKHWNTRRSQRYY